MNTNTNSLVQLVPYLANKFFRAITLFGSSFFYLFIIVFLVRINAQLGIKTLMAFTLVELVTGILKLIYPKNRPTHNNKRTTLLDKYEAGSFPSIHSARAAVLAVLGYYLFSPDPIILIFILTMTLTIAYSRIYLKRHFLIDVLAGLTLGFVIGNLFITT